MQTRTLVGTPDPDPNFYRGTWNNGTLAYSNAYGTTFASSIMITMAPPTTWHG